MYVPPHNKIARDVKEKDLKKVIKLGLKMVEMCKEQYGFHHGALAIAHPQIESKDPMRFFVTKEGALVINPVVTNNTSSTKMREEGCMSFPKKKRAWVARHYKLEVEFFMLDEGKESMVKRQATVKGKEAQIWQHEIDHFNGINVWGEYGKEHII